MRRKHQRTLELIFVRPVSGSVPWRDVLALFQELGAEVSKREGSRVADEVRCSMPCTERDLKAAEAYG